MLQYYHYFSTTCRNHDLLYLLYDVIVNSVWAYELTGMYWYIIVRIDLYFILGAINLSSRLVTPRWLIICWGRCCTLVAGGDICYKEGGVMLWFPLHFRALCTFYTNVFVLLICYSYIYLNFVCFSLPIERQQRWCNKPLIIKVTHSSKLPYCGYTAG